MVSPDGDFQKLVYARIQAMPEGTSISIGDSGTLSKSELLKHVAEGDEIGQKMIEIERAFFKALKDGSLYDYAE
ncbi:MAG TPA: hypothetical protein VMU97_00530 [Candidatus Dormibacteraeota bacterium]|nr:hypothetical protein [Candidatus Dormibacteraeota bacterium]